MALRVQWASYAKSSSTEKSQNIIEMTRHSCKHITRDGEEESKDDFGYSTTRKFVVEDVVNSGQKMAEEALFLVK